jgi:hypothetical protein
LISGTLSRRQLTHFYSAVDMCQWRRRIVPTGGEKVYH